MRIILQRVKKGSVLINSKINKSINKGLVLLVGIVSDDTQDDINWIVKKVINMRIFPDENNKMNLSLMDIKGELLLISQFTLYASTKKGNRPSYIKAAHPDVAIPIYTELIENFKNSITTNIETGEFGADMEVSIINDGPVTIILDSKNKE